MGCPSRQRLKSQSDINKSMEGNQSQENFHSNQGHFVCQPTAPSVRESPIHIGLKQMMIDGKPSMMSCPLFSETAWRDLSEGNCILSLKLYMQCALISLELQTSKKENTIRTANRRQREKSRLRVEQRLGVGKEKNSQSKGKDLCHCKSGKRNEAATKKKQKKQKTIGSANPSPQKKRLNSPRNCSRGKNGVLNIPKKGPTHRHSSRPS